MYYQKPDRGIKVRGTAYFKQELHGLTRRLENGATG